MKHLLIAASLLAMSAGYAAADISWTGSAAAGVAKNGTSNGGSADPNTSGLSDDAFHAYSNFSLSIAATGQTDSGLSFGVDSGISSGRTYALANDDGFGSNGGTLDAPSVWVSGSFGKVTFKSDGLDFFDTDAANSGKGDVQYDGTFGGVTVGLVADIESGDMSVKGGYSMGAISVGANYNQNGGGTALWNANASYTMGSITGTVSAANDGTANATEEHVKVAYSANGISASAQYNTSDASVDLSVGYASGPYSVTVSDNTVSSHWSATGSYDLGGGLSLEAGTNYTGDVMVGAKMSF